MFPHLLFPALMLPSIAAVLSPSLPVSRCFGQIVTHCSFGGTITLRLICFIPEEVSEKDLLI